MEDHSIFMEKTVTPTEESLKLHLGDRFQYWVKIEDYVFKKYPKGEAGWNFSGKKHGWSFRIKDKRRTIIYFLPRKGYFKVAFVYGQKAFDAIMPSSIAEEIKIELREAKKYAEGRGIAIPIRKTEILDDIFRLIDIKLAY